MLIDGSGAAGYRSLVWLPSRLRPKGLGRTSQTKGNRGPTEPPRWALFREEGGAPGAALAHAPEAHVSEIDTPAPVSQIAGGLPDLSGLTARQAVVETGALGLRVQLEGRGFVLRQTPAPGTPLDTAGETVHVWLSEGAGS